MRYISRRNSSSLPGPEKASFTDAGDSIEAHAWYRMRSGLWWTYLKTRSGHKKRASPQDFTNHLKTTKMKEAPQVKPFAADDPTVSTLVIYLSAEAFFFRLITSLEALYFCFYGYFPPEISEFIGTSE